mmetsp:Transcript_19355/g.16567  ORF Transcript_19355/g.16567 Transcript_19355/m.16567 type:complete len:166 (-) Transcript_19355:288-785(-)
MRQYQEYQKEKEKNSQFHDSLAEEMKCCICLDYIHQCVTTIPCLHNFCSACLSCWIDKSNDCPECRQSMSHIKKNQTVNNIIEKFMNNNPDKKRSKQELEEMDKNNTIKDDVIDLTKSKHSNNSNSNTWNSSDSFGPPRRGGRRGGGNGSRRNNNAGGGGGGILA